MSKLKGKSEQLKKAQYYVQYLGWKECRGLGGREFTEPILKDLVIRRRTDDLPKLTIEVSKKELKIHQIVEHKKGKTEKIKYPTVPAKDLTYAIAGLSPDEDVVATIYLGYNHTTRCAVHVHVYRCDSQETADVFVHHLNQIISSPEHQARLEKIEEELVTKGQITPRPKGFASQYLDSFNSGPGSSPTLNTLDQDFSDEDLDSSPDSEQLARQDQRNSGMAVNPGYGHKRVPLRQWESRDQVVPMANPRHSAEYGSELVYDKEAEIKMESLNSELKNKLAMTKKPLLLPPKDYDTVSRGHGNLSGIEMRRSQNDVIVGGSSGMRRSSGEDSAHGDSESGSYGYGPKSADPRRRNSERLYSNNDDNNDIQAVSPRWKLGHGQYVPPTGGRPVNQAPWDDPSRPKRSSGWSGDREPASSYDHARSPPGRSSSPDEYRRTGRTRSPEPAHVPAFVNAFYNDNYPTHNRDQNGQRTDNKKYTASNLGLTDGSAPLRSSRYNDEGYTSMDRREPAGRPVSTGAEAIDYVQNDKRGKDKYKDKKQKKDKKKKSKAFPGDEIPIDYTIGPAQAKTSQYDYRR